MTWERSQELELFVSENPVDRCRWECVNCWTQMTCEAQIKLWRSLLSTSGCKLPNVFFTWLECSLIYSNILSQSWDHWQNRAHVWNADGEREPAVDFQGFADSWRSLIATTTTTRLDLTLIIVLVWHNLSDDTKTLDLTKLLVRAGQEFLHDRELIQVWHCLNFMYGRWRSDRGCGRYSTTSD